MPRRARPATLLASVLVGGLLAAATAAPAGAAVNTRCGGKGAYRLAQSASVIVVVRETNEDDLYGGDHRVSACYGKHGKAKTLLALTSPNSPTFGSVAFSGKFVAVAYSLRDGSCGKYVPGEDCDPTEHIDAWNAKTGRRATAARPTPTEAVQGLAVGPTGGIAWIESVNEAAAEETLRYAFGDRQDDIASSFFEPDGLRVTRSAVYYRDVSGRTRVPLPPAVAPTTAP